VAHVSPGSPADKAGLKIYDVITHFNGKEVTTAEALLQLIHSAKIGDNVTITSISRDKSTKTVTVRLEQSPTPAK